MPDPLNDEMLRVDIQESYQRLRKLREPETSPREMGSVMFTMWQHALLQEAKEGFITRAPEPGEPVADPAMPRPRGLREISLAGIAYTAENDWTVWLNGQRLTPDALPEQVIDIRVRKDYIELKWFDTFTNLIYPIRIRPHQRFNLDSRIFLPGAAAATAAETGAL